MRIITVLAMVLGSCMALFAQPQIVVDVSQAGAEISPTMYGVFFEDINFGADGGLYAELVKNRSFEFFKPLEGWKVVKKAGANGDVLVLRDEKQQRNPRHIRIRVDQPGEGFGLTNEGFRGMGIRESADYRFQCNAKSHTGELSIQIQLVDDKGRVLAKSHIDGISSNWETYECEMTANATEEKASLILWFEGVGSINVDMVSLFPKDTWKGRKNGLRKDLVQLLADMKPGFLRFPGGCIVEGFDLSQRYQWKHTIGDPAERVLNINRWNFEFKHRPAPDYFQSYGLGYYEYFVLAKDIGAEPMPIINCGMACQFNSCELVSMDQLEPYVQDALDLIEFANGSTESLWGKIRADMGHPEPFNLKMLGVGNEQWGPQYIERYKVFASAIHEKYPEMQLIAATGSDATIFPNGQEEIDYLWSQWRIIEPSFVDEHFYRPPEWFLENVGFYDDYDRNEPKIFVGEWASQSERVGSPGNRNTWKTALYEAAFMTGLERNADLVRMTCYAPLFAHEEAWQWRPDLIWFDNLKSYGSANYYVQKLYSLNAGTHLLSAKLSETTFDSLNGLYTSAVLDKDAEDVIIKVVNVADTEIVADINLQKVKVGNTAHVLVLSSEHMDDENSLQEPRKIYPIESLVQLDGSQFSYKFTPLSLTVIRVPVE